MVNPKYNIVKIWKDDKMKISKKVMPVFLSLLLSVTSMGVLATEVPQAEEVKRPIGFKTMLSGNLDKKQVSMVSDAISTLSQTELLVKQGYSAKQAGVISLGWDKLLSAGFTESSASGILGAVGVRSDFDPEFKEDNKFGLLAWDKEAKKDLEEFAKKVKKDKSDIDVQFDFLISELKEDIGTSYDFLRSYDDLAYSFESFCESEIPNETVNYTLGITSARKIYSALKGTAPVKSESKEVKISVSEGNIGDKEVEMKVKCTLSPNITYIFEVRDDDTGELLKQSLYKVTVSKTKTLTAKVPSGSNCYYSVRAISTPSSLTSIKGGKGVHKTAPIKPEPVNDNTQNEGIDTQSLSDTPVSEPSVEAESTSTVNNSSQMSSLISRGYSEKQAYVIVTVWNALRDAGCSPEGTAGILGNIGAECNYDQTAGALGAGGYGLIQWTGGRNSDLANYAYSQGKDVSDLGVQIDFLIKDIYNTVYEHGTGYTMAEMRSASSVSYATEAFCWMIERPGIPAMERRHNHAQIIYDALA